MQVHLPLDRLAAQDALRQARLSLHGELQLHGGELVELPKQTVRRRLRHLHPFDPQGFSKLVRVAIAQHADAGPAG